MAFLAKLNLRLQRRTQTSMHKGKTTTLGAAKKIREPEKKSEAGYDRHEEMCVG